jgi:hypothetical protein
MLKLSRPRRPQKDYHAVAHGSFQLDLNELDWSNDESTTADDLWMAKFEKCLVSEENNTTQKEVTNG